MEHSAEWRLAGTGFPALGADVRTLDTLVDTLGRKNCHRAVFRHRVSIDAVLQGVKRGEGGGIGPRHKGPYMHDAQRTITIIYDSLLTEEKVSISLKTSDNTVGSDSTDSPTQHPYSVRNDLLCPAPQSIP